MSDKGIYNLSISQEFTFLIAPRESLEYNRLKASLLKEGCKDPIITWNGFIVDGHNRYRICTSNRIPFEVKEAEFECKDIAIAWICLNQLCRSDLTEERRHYLIGKQFDAERSAYWYSIDANGVSQPMTRTAVRQKLSGKIAQENNISTGTVEKYSRYARALDAINAKRPEMARQILLGRYKISHSNVEEISKLSPKELKKVQTRIEQLQEADALKFYQIRSILNNNIMKSKSKDILSGTSVKDMPKFDPDAEVVGLTLTIPSWISSVDRLMKKTDLSIASVKAKNNLNHTVYELIDHLKRLLSAIEEQ